MKIQEIINMINPDEFDEDLCVYCYEYIILNFYFQSLVE